MSEHDAVNHPQHYTDHPRLQNAIECRSGGWHLGHKPRLPVRGRISRDDIYQRPGGAA